MPAEGTIEVLLVDDSAVVREVVQRVLARVPDVRVTAAADPILAMERMKSRRPDVLLLDLELPRMSGFTFLEMLMAEDPLPVVVLSGTAPEGSERALRALDLGALALVAKPSLGVAAFLDESWQYLAEVIRSAARVRVRKRRIPRQKERIAAWMQAPRPFGVAPPERPSEALVVIGASTGGPDALRAVLSELDADDAGVVIAQHLPPGVTEALAQRLDASTRMRVREATHGEPVLAGHALVCPGGHHVELRGVPGALRVVLEPARPGDRCRPSIDRLFFSAARRAGSVAVGVLLTGMGADGAEGLGALRGAGALTIAEDESSCAVFGMPRRAIERGFVDFTLPAEKIARAIVHHTRAGARA